MVSRWAPWKFARIFSFSARWTNENESRKISCIRSPTGLKWRTDRLLGSLNYAINDRFGFRFFFFSSKKSLFFFSFPRFRKQIHFDFLKDRQALFHQRTTVIHFITTTSFVMYRFFAIASSLLVFLIASSSTAFVVDTGNKAAVTTPIQLDIDLTQKSNACCTSYPYCSCPKLEAKTRRTTKIHQIKLPAAKQQQASNNYECCANYPYCSCPKLETAPVMNNRIHQIKLLSAKQVNSNSCCPDFPYCGCPKL